MIQNTLLKFVLAFFIIFTLTACYEEREGQLAVNTFLKEMSPELAQKIAKIEEEISLTEKKIDKLSELKRKHPNYAGKIETSRRQWEVLQGKLRQSLKEIRDVVESAYVTYELDRIQGGNQFNKISGELLSSADSVLASAGTTKNAIEQALTEVENQPLPLLDDANYSSISQEDNTSKEENFENEEKPSIVETTSPLKSLSTPPHSSPKISCDARTFLANIRLNLMMMVISMDEAEKDALKRELNQAIMDFEGIIALLPIDVDKLTTLRETWVRFKNTIESEIIPAIQIGNHDKALAITDGIQAERKKIMDDIIQVFSGDNCD